MRSAVFSDCSERFFSSSSTSKGLDESWGGGAVERQKDLSMNQCVRVKKNPKDAPLKGVHVSLGLSPTIQTQLQLAGEECSRTPVSIGYPWAFELMGILPLLPLALLSHSQDSHEWTEPPD